MFAPPSQPSPPAAPLRALLQRHFGFDNFRASQEEVCQSLVTGQDVLLVMPTGAGKSLCYQLPGLALRGTTLVISPLIALIEDQTAKLKSLRLRAQAIHSGIERERARAVCLDYLQGKLDFLFIAPERLAVPGFPEMLARRPPELIAIDEAHCISQWGHDFRPEYRRLGERVAILRPTPIIALTATATPRVQDDILRQLEIPGARRFIQGFRRENISIEAHEVPKGARAQSALQLLTEPGRTPAIVYAPTRKAAEELAEHLRTRLRAEAYHAGMPSEVREGVQSRFLGSQCDVIVATIAFGMGIDKPDVRTVIHAGLSGSVEGYYQEIGRAGRDGLPSQAILLYSYADLKTHEFFLDRDYPEPGELRKLYHAIGRDAKPRDQLEALLCGRGTVPTPAMGADTFEKSLEKLWTQGGVAIDADENVSRASSDWERAYIEQREYKKQTLRLVSAFAETSACRMLYFLRHFGDRADSTRPCGLCDRCRPGAPSRGFSTRRKLDARENKCVTLMLAALAGRGAPLAAGRLFEETAGTERDLKRGDFERLLRILVDAGFASVTEDTFEKDGKTIGYRRIKLTRKGATAKAADLAALEASEATFATARQGKTARERPAKTQAESSNAPPKMRDEAWDATQDASFQKLRAWRTNEARRQSVPPFRILSDRVLRALVVARPANPRTLLQVRGMGPKLCERYGKELLACLGP